MVLVKAEEMVAGITKDERIALCNIYFDTDQTDLKPEYNSTLEQIAALMKADPKLNILVVGHTDNQGGFDHNIELPKRRATAVATALTSRHGIAASRLKAHGVGIAA
ncbi:hypothetical protein DFAR_330018 [Desulfarculales bacterium]